MLSPIWVGELNVLTIEARVGRWQPVFVAIVAMNVETAHTIHALKFLESVERDFTGTSDELKQLGSLFLVEGPHGSPEPLNLL